MPVSGARSVPFLFLFLLPRPAVEKWYAAFSPHFLQKQNINQETNLDLSLLSLDLSLDLDLCLDLRSLDLDLRSFDLDFLSLDLDLRSRDLDLLSLERDFLCFDLDLRSRDRDLLSLGFDSRSFDFGSRCSLKLNNYCWTLRKAWTNLSLVLESLSLEALPADRPPGEPWSGFCNGKIEKLCETPVSTSANPCWLSHSCCSRWRASKFSRICFWKQKLYIYCRLSQIIINSFHLKVDCDTWEASVKPLQPKRTAEWNGSSWWRKQDFDSCRSDDAKVRVVKVGTWWA